MSVRYLNIYVERQGNTQPIGDIENDGPVQGPELHQVLISNPI